MRLVQVGYKVTIFMQPIPFGPAQSSSLSERPIILAMISPKVSRGIYSNYATTSLYASKLSLYLNVRENVHERNSILMHLKRGDDSSSFKIIS